MLKRDFYFKVADPGQLNLVCQPENVVRVITNAAASVQPRINSKGISLELDLPAELPLYIA